MWAGVGLDAAGAVAAACYALGLWLLLGAGLRRAGGRFGPADAVTLVRAVLVGGVAALVADGLVADGLAGGPEHPGDPARWVLAALAAVALALDALDGRVARRTRTVSPLGARFDMEVDAVLLLVLSADAAAGPVGAWVLAIGAMRYMFGGAGRVLPWLRAPLPPSTARKAVAGAQGVVLVALAAGVPVVAAPWAAPAAAGAALALLCWSFGRDVVWLWRHRAVRQKSGTGSGPNA
ncbi:CDP-alcohol phosphatidyltransferase family protein [Streptomonospora sp. S1-112]|uniref:CDP-alcohol phosphatidyltransferase family protein n=1 Tax=Streptomonospora mangrovi TaxID=2883123 RepID=A0A9X3SGZ7_9ACTN|nr:CDP-alcohol phosphatidyltransferase family protein [Streptomonospora mangrovi]MDA0566535.1 CDP-alcohol phosphatidyltransferase family protein [Streptomonospora mangrovi]